MSMMIVSVMMVMKTHLSKHLASSIHPDKVLFHLPDLSQMFQMEAQSNVSIVHLVEEISDDGGGGDLGGDESVGGDSINCSASPEETVQNFLEQVHHPGHPNKQNGKHC